MGSAGTFKLDYSPAEIVSTTNVAFFMLPIVSIVLKQGMRKILSITRHLLCIMWKCLCGRDFGWHWQHILREFGFGRYMR